TLVRMARHLDRLLLSMQRRPDDTLALLAWIDGDERHALLVAFNDSAVVYPVVRDIVEWCAAHVARTPDAPAVMHEDARRSYRELDAWSN
ncbi:hypothetical protein M1717_26270, partial [Salmonella enterica subsp. enterica serovar Pomona]|uniref:hypothetical protein n=1 Tax=Salmonella enterica TaxID=28901 RepID=UPI0021B3155C